MACLKSNTIVTIEYPCISCDESIKLHQLNNFEIYPFHNFNILNKLFKNQIRKKLLTNQNFVSTPTFNKCNEWDV